MIKIGFDIRSCVVGLHFEKLTYNIGGEAHKCNIIWLYFLPFCYIKLYIVKNLMDDY